MPGPDKAYAIAGRIAARLAAGDCHNRAVRTALKILAALALLYGAAAAILYSYMRRPPDQFTRFMAETPRPAMLALPFRPLWFRARAGALQPGDSAPDFELDTLDHASRVRLSSLRGERPVVLVFGSYT